MKKALYACLLILVVGGAFLAGAWYTQRAATKSSPAAARKILYYVDPMHPAYKSDKPGIAPDCGMELVPVYENGSMAGPEGMAALPPGTVNVTQEKQQLIGVRLGPVERMGATHTLRTVGRVAVDENRVYRLVAPADGLVIRLEGGTTGSEVKKGDLLATFYSRDLLAAQQTYFTTLNSVSRIRSGGAPEDQVVVANVQMRIAEGNLVALGMGEAQVREITRSRQRAARQSLRGQLPACQSATRILAGRRSDEEYGRGGGMEICHEEPCYTLPRLRTAPVGVCTEKSREPIAPFDPVWQERDQEGENQPGGCQGHLEVDPGKNGNSTRGGLWTG